MITPTDTLQHIVFSPDESLQGSCNSYTVPKCFFKFRNLQMFCYFCNTKPTQGLKKLSHVILRITIFRVYWDLRLKLTVPEINISHNNLHQKQKHVYITLLTIVFFSLDYKHFSNYMLKIDQLHTKI